MNLIPRAAVLLLVLLLSFKEDISAQASLGALTPDNSAMLDITATGKTS